MGISGSSYPGAGEGTYIGDAGLLGNDGNANPVGYDIYGFDYGTGTDPGAERYNGAVPHHLGCISSIPINKCESNYIISVIYIWILMK